MKKIKLLVLLVVIISCILLIIGYSKSEGKYLQDVARDAGYNFRSDVMKSILSLEKGDELTVDSGGKKYSVEVIDISLTPIDHGISQDKRANYNDSLTSYSIDGQYVCVTDEEIMRLANGEVSSRLCEQSDEYTYKVKINNQVTQFVFVRNILEEYNRPTYYIIVIENTNLDTRPGALDSYNATKNDIDAYLYYNEALNHIMENKI